MNYKTLRAAAIAGDLEQTKYFLDKGYNPSQKILTGTLLQFVIQHNHQDIAILLMKYGAEVNTQDKFGITPLHEAAKNGNEILIRELLSRNAKIFIKDIIGRTPGSIAAELGFCNVARLLHSAFQTMLVNKPSSFFKSDQNIKNGEKVEIEIDPSFVTKITNFTF